MHENVFIFFWNCTHPSPIQRFTNIRLWFKNNKTCLLLVCCLFWPQIRNSLNSLRIIRFIKIYPFFMVSSLRHNTMVYRLLVKILQDQTIIYLLVRVGLNITMSSIFVCDFKYLKNAPRTHELPCKLFDVRNPRQKRQRLNSWIVTTLGQRNFDKYFYYWYYGNSYANRLLKNINRKHLRTAKILLISILQWDSLRGERVL